MRRFPGVLGVGLAMALLAAACSSHPTTYSATHVADPPKTVAPSPDYTQSCSPSGPDASIECLAVILQAIDRARAGEHIGPMLLPGDYDKLTAAQQFLVAVDRERVDRRLAPLAGVSDALVSIAAQGADAGKLPPDPGAGYTNADTEWVGAAANPLDAVYQWMYQKGSGTGAAAWDDRHSLLDDFGTSGTAVVGASFNPTADTDAGDHGGTSFAAVLAAAASPGPLAYTWSQATTDVAAGALRPRNALPASASATHIADPPKTVPANPDFSQACAQSGLDSSPACLQPVLVAVDNARSAEGVKAMVLPAGFGSLTVAQQVFVAINVERTDRGLPPFKGLTTALNANAQRGADIANDPPDPGGDYDVVDTEWAGGSSNGLDAVYGWMYDDGIGSGNLDCPKGGGPGCWGHRHGILDNFGTVGTMVMGAAVNPTSDTGDDKGGTSIAATLAITSRPVAGYTFTG